MLFEFDSVKVNCADGISKMEAEAYLQEQLELMPHKTLLAMDIAIEGDEAIIKPYYDSIVRVRRITGYLSTLPRFNDAKKKEAADRVAHIG